MAGIDYGVITLENGQLKPGIRHGEGSTFYLEENKGFYRTGFEHAENVFRGHYFHLEKKRKLVYTWSFEKDEKEILVKTKALGANIYLSFFTMDGNHYKVIQGYDVSLRFCWEKSTKKTIKKLLKKYVVK